MNGFGLDKRNGVVWLGVLGFWAEIKYVASL